MNLLENKKALIIGVASNRSIAYGIAKQMRAHGAQLAFSYIGERFKSRLTSIAQEFDSKLTFPCDVSNDNEIKEMIQWISNEWKTIDIIVHATAFAPTEMLGGDYLEHMNQEGFKTAHEISSYSLAAICKHARPHLNQSSILTLSYIGAQQAIPSYNVMGVAKASLESNVRYLAACLGPEGHRVNAISAGPIKTLSASAIKGFKEKLIHDANTNPLRRNTTQEDVGNAATFLCSSLSSGITGEVLYVDNGNHILGAN